MYILRSAVTLGSPSLCGMKGCASKLPEGRLPLSSVRKPVYGVTWYVFSAVWNSWIPPSLFSTPKVAMPCPRLT